MPSPPPYGYETVINIDMLDTTGRVGDGNNEVLQNTVRAPNYESVQFKFNPPEPLEYTLHSFLLEIFSDPRRITNVVNVQGVNELDEDEESILFVTCNASLATLKAGNTYYCVLRRVDGSPFIQPLNIVFASFILHIENYGVFIPP